MPNTDISAPALEEVKANKGENFTLSLFSYGTSGYVWRAREPQGLVALIGRDIVPGKDIGDSGLETLTFCCNEVGVHDLVLDNLRPWESEERESKHYRIVVE